MTRASGAQKQIFFAYRRMPDMPIKVARIFNTYGPNMHPSDGRVTSNLILDLAGLVAELTGVEQGPQYHLQPEDDPQRRRPLFDEARRILSWSPTTSRRDGLVATIDHIRVRADVSDPAHCVGAARG